MMKYKKLKIVLRLLLICNITIAQPKIKFDSLEYRVINAKCGEPVKLKIPVYNIGNKPFVIYSTQGNGAPSVTRPMRPILPGGSDSIEFMMPPMYFSGTISTMISIITSIDDISIIIPVKITYNKVNCKVMASGYVLDEDNQPLPGASIRVINTKWGTTTDVNGFYSIKAYWDDTLEFSYVFYMPKKIKVSEIRNETKLQRDERYIKGSEIPIPSPHLPKRKKEIGMVKVVASRDVQKVNDLQKTLPHKAFIGKWANLNIGVEISERGISAMQNKKDNWEVSQLDKEHYPFFDTALINTANQFNCFTLSEYVKIEDIPDGGFKAIKNTSYKTYKIELIDKNTIRLQTCNLSTSSSINKSPSKEEWGKLRNELVRNHGYYNYTTAILKKIPNEQFSSKPKDVIQFKLSKPNNGFTGKWIAKDKTSGYEISDKGISYIKENWANDWLKENEFSYSDTANISTQKIFETWVYSTGASWVREEPDSSGRVKQYFPKDINYQLLRVELINSNTIKLMLSESYQFDGLGAPKSTASNINKMKQSFKRNKKYETVAVLKRIKEE